MVKERVFGGGGGMVQGQYDNNAWEYHSYKWHRPESVKGNEKDALYQARARRPHLLDLIQTLLQTKSRSSHLQSNLMSRSNLLNHPRQKTQTQTRPMRSHCRLGFNLLWIKPFLRGHLRPRLHYPSRFLHSYLRQIPKGMTRVRSRCWRTGSGNFGCPRLQMDSKKI